MRPETIAIIPEVGYNPYQNSSVKSYMLLSYYSYKNKVRVHHAKNGQEYRLGQYLLDGAVLDEKGNLSLALEFHGCLYHGCPKCFNPESINPIKQEKMVFTFNRHQKRIEYIKQNVSTLIEIWECEFDQLTKTDEDLKLFINSLEIRERIKPRDALFGGRTNASKLYHKAKENEIILHYDFTSLYPSVQKYCRFPIGHPKIITENIDCDISNYFGLIKCRILPPKKLHFHVLPVKSHNKLVFPLCLKCSELQSKETCLHSDTERMIEGTACFCTRGTIHRKNLRK